MNIFTKVQGLAQQTRYVQSAAHPTQRAPCSEVSEWGGHGSTSHLLLVLRLYQFPKITRFCDVIMAGDMHTFCTVSFQIGKHDNTSNSLLVAICSTSVFLDQSDLNDDISVAQVFSYTSTHCHVFLKLLCYFFIICF